MTKPAKPKPEATQLPAAASVAPPVITQDQNAQVSAVTALTSRVTIPDPSFVLNGFQLRQALAFLAPDNTADQLEDGLLLTCSATAGDSGAGVYAQHAECPEEGSVLLTGKGYEVVEDQAVPEGPSEAGQSLRPGIGLQVSLGGTDVELSAGFLAVLAERVRVIVDKGRTTAMDDSYQRGELVQAAACYAGIAAGGSGIKARQAWPFDLNTFKPGEPTRDLIKSAQFLIAELDRRYRAGDPILNSNN